MDEPLYYPYSIGYPGNIIGMLLILRIMAIGVMTLLICLFGALFCLFKPRDPRHVQTFGHLFGRLAPLLGFKVILRFPPDALSLGRAVYIANHQNNYDMVTVSAMTQARTVTVGKKSLIWVPFFGVLYWLAGNILINRNNRTSAFNTLVQIAQEIHARDISVWMFPEGTRSRGRGLMPFKTGAFYTAILAEIPIIPICVSNLQNKVKLNRWDNGYVIIEMLAPIDTTGYSKEQARQLTQHCYQLMRSKLEALNVEVARWEEQGKKKDQHDRH